MVLALVAGRGWAQSADGGPGLEQLVREAMARDTTLQQRQLAVRRSQIGVAMTAAGRGFSLALRLSDPEGPEAAGRSDRQRSGRGRHSGSALPPA